jgi:hypothetical protein
MTVKKLGQRLTDSTASKAKAARRGVTVPTRLKLQAHGEKPDSF